MQHVKRSLNAWRNACAFLLFFTILGSVCLAQTVSLVATFNGANGQEPNSIMQGTDGNFYGTTSFGGAYQEGTIFQLTPSGSLTSLYSFCAQIIHTCSDGSVPQGAPLVQSSDGNFYGTTGTGGSSAANSGTMFQITPGGQLTTLYNFTGFPTGGSIPLGLVQAPDGNFYGVTDQGGATCGSLGCGTFFKVTPQGDLTVLHNFCSQAGCTDGSYPRAVMLAANGNFYGTTLAGGSSDQLCGTVFEITPGGHLTTLHRFNHSDGCEPLWGVTQGPDGSFYGTTSRGGSRGAGTVFRMNAAGTLTGFYSFCSQTNCADGYLPNAPLLQGSDGNLYGTTSLGGAGARSAGTIFRVTRLGTVTTLYSFCQEKACPEGGKPTGSLIQANDGNIYGVNEEGGSGGGAGSGTVFRLTLAPAATLKRTRD